MSCSTPNTSEITTFRMYRNASIIVLLGYCYFSWTACIDGEMCSVLMMGNCQTPILPVIICLAALLQISSYVIIAARCIFIRMVYTLTVLTSVTVYFVGYHRLRDDYAQFAECSVRWGPST